MYIRLQRDGAIATLRLDKPHGNAIDPDLVRELTAVGREMAQDEGVRGVMLASAHSKVFCPGLDIPTLLEFDRATLTDFMRSFARALWGLYGLEKPTVAALAGHAVAGGCVLAMTADWRVLRRGARIGLNEVKVGVPLPWSVALLLHDRVPNRAHSAVALLGRNFQDEGATEAGLADELAADAASTEAQARERLAEFVDKDVSAFAATKRYLRRDALARMQAEEDTRVDDFVNCWFSPSAQARLREVAARLKA